MQRRSVLTTLACALFILIGATPALGADTLYSTKVAAAVRTSASSTAQVVRTLSPNVLLTIVSTVTNPTYGTLWGKTYNGTYVYMGNLTRSYTTIDSPGQYVVRTSTAPLRTGPNLGWGAVKSLALNAPVHLERVFYNDAGAEWGKTFDGYYVPTSYLKMRLGPAGYYVTSAANVALRSGAGSHFNVVETKPTAGTPVYVTSTLYNTAGNAWGKTSTGSWVWMGNVTETWRWPTSSSVNVISQMGMRSGSLHSGIDIGVNGKTVQAANGGVVVDSYNGCSHYSNASDACGYGYGNYVVIRHGSVTTVYAHMKQNSIPASVYKGAYVARGTVIGTSWSSGRSGGPHLHFEIRLTHYAATPAHWTRWTPWHVNPLSLPAGSVANPLVGYDDPQRVGTDNWEVARATIDSRWRTAGASGLSWFPTQTPSYVPKMVRYYSL